MVVIQAKPNVYSTLGVAKKSLHRSCEKKKIDTKRYKIKAERFGDNRSLKVVLFLQSWILIWLEL